MSRHILAAFALFLALPAAAFAADEGVGATGLISQLEVNTLSADQYLQYHGRVVIKANTGSSEYRWGGTSCGSYTLTDNQVALLQGALDGGLKVLPRYRMGQGDLMCLVGFRMTP
jgi:hypothetical protein